MLKLFLWNSGISKCLQIISWYVKELQYKKAFLNVPEFFHTKKEVKQLTQTRIRLDPPKRWMGHSVKPSVAPEHSTLLWKPFFFFFFYCVFFSISNVFYVGLFNYMEPYWNTVQEDRVKLQLVTQHFDLIDWHFFLKEWDKVWKLHILDHPFQQNAQVSWSKSSLCYLLCIIPLC